MPRLADFARRRIVTAVLSVWSPGKKITNEEVAERLNCKLDDVTNEYVSRVKASVYAAEYLDKSFIPELFYFSEIARSIEDGRQESKQTERVAEEQGSYCRC